MRPLRLTVEAFTCFKERQPQLDLSALELFAIAGPTGAGKSSLLDAIIFALYGRVPRMRRGYGELISLGRDRMSVTLDFRVGRREFRIARVARRGRSTEAQLDELAAGGERSIAGGVQSVEQHVARLLGLRYEAFTQAVVLPQGEFARFLKSQPRERREILRDLLRLQVYERMRRVAAESSRELELRLGSVRERLTEDYAGVEPSQLPTLEQSLRSREKANRRTAAELATLQTELEDKRAGFQKTQELVEKRTELATLAEQQQKIETMEKNLDSARRAAPLVPLWNAARSAEQRSEDDRRRSKEAADARTNLHRSHQEAGRRLEKARRQAEQLPVLAEKIRALDEIKGLLAPSESATRRREEARTRLRALEKSVEVSGEQERNARSAAERLERERDEISRQVEGVGYHEEIDRRLDATRDRVSALGAQRKAALEARSDAEKAERRAHRDRELASDSKAAVDKLRKTVGAKTSARKKTEEKLQKVERAHAAAHLRGQLHRGGKCPVCDQVVARLPPALRAASVETLRSRLDALRAAEEGARSSLEKEVAKEAEARATLKASEREARTAAKKAARTEQTVERVERELTEAIGNLVDDEPATDLEGRILSAIERSTTRRETYQGAKRRHDEIQKKLSEAQRALDKREQESASLREQMEEAVARTREAEQEAVELQKRIAAITKFPDPSKEREELAKRKFEVEESLKSAEEYERKTRDDLSSMTKVFQEAERTVRESTRVALEARKGALEAMGSAGFRDENAVREAALAIAEASRIEKEATSYRQKRHALERRLSELEETLGAGVVSRQDLDHAEEELKLKRIDHEEGLRKKLQLEQQLAELRRSMERAAELTARQASLEQESTITRRLATDLRSENFQAYLLEEAFRELVAGASVRLEGLSGRYTLAYEQDAFHVLDQDNAGERRSADTLSGGETFLASLALALELSEQVQRAAGAVNLDSLFIDEGFGTLDPETLDTVASAIESLHVGGRMVGIVTHIRELTERLPARIRVERDAAGSRICQPTF